ncbi:MAG: beta-N-acetylhexosaminidase [Deltaproteobacteria bacterium CG_4_9_14_3_um_filter_63_12]|nr:MAG: beta-N-acetylhexosaminidase [Deltaproteobacteria bacterium CG_4_9_14_3_um_filter_63_12]
MKAHDLDLQAAAGQLLAVGFDGETLPVYVEKALVEGRIGGTLLFRRNIEDLEQVRALNLHTLALPLPFLPWICVDQEGGRVRRLVESLGVSPIPAMRALGRHDDPELAAQLGEIVGRELAALGFNVNFAPVLDVDSNPANPIIGDRAFSANPEQVGRLAVAFAKGLANAGIVACGKHFPGHGDTDLDSHLALPVLDFARERLDGLELVPFRAAVEAAMPMLMTAHILLPKLDPDHPATLSRPILRGILREELGYHGLIVSDDLDMKAVADRYTVEEAVQLGLEAGIDFFLVCHERERWERAHAALVRLAERDARARAQLEQAAQRVIDAKRRLLSPTPVGDGWRSLIGADAYQLVLERFSS